MKSFARNILAALLLVIFLAGCESMYYNLVMDKPEKGDKGKEKEDMWEKAGDTSRIGRYR